MSYSVHPVTTGPITLAFEYEPESDARTAQVMKLVEDGRTTFVMYDLHECRRMSCVICKTPIGTCCGHCSGD